MSNITTTITTKMWLTPHTTIGPQDFDKPEILERVIYGNVDMTKAGWTCIGEATITAKFVDREAAIENKVKALREEIKTTRADAEMKVRRLEEQVNNLLAITYETA